MKLLNKFSFISWLIVACWFITMAIEGNWSLFVHHYLVAITMAFGSFIAGATSEGGGAVAFPIMTLALNIKPAVARDFSLLIQSFGMTAASAAIIKSQIMVEKRTILYATGGGVLGNVLAFLFLEQLFSPPALKIFFCSTWLAFAFVLMKMKVFKQTDRREAVPPLLHYDALIFGVGIIGGCLSALMGTGLDIMTFSLLTLYFNVCEKVATPTSVILMAINSMTAVLLKIFVFDGVDPLAVDFLKVCIPIVVFGAPIGSLFITTRSRSFITLFLIFTISLQFIAALVIIPMTTPLLQVMVITFVGALSLFTLFTLISPHRLKTRQVIKK